MGEGSIYRNGRSNERSFVSLGYRVTQSIPAERDP